MAFNDSFLRNDAYLIDNGSPPTRPPLLAAVLRMVISTTPHWYLTIFPVTEQLYPAQLYPAFHTRNAVNLWD